MNTNYDVFTNDIFNFLKQTRVPTETRDNLKILEDDFKKLFSLYESLKPIRKVIDCLLSSSIIDTVLEQKDLFSKDYYNYLRNSISTLPYSIQNVTSFYDSNKSDSYYGFKELYNYLKEPPLKLMNEYNLDPLNTYVPSYRLGIYKDSCSVCQGQIARTTRDLDHYINKQYFPLLCITIENLVPTCEICNRNYKRNRLPKLPIVHPYEEDFPIKKIPLFLEKNLDGYILMIDETGLPPKYKNYIELMNLDNRLKHDDISAIISNLIKDIFERTEKRIDFTSTPDEALIIFNEEISNCKASLPNSNFEHNYIKKQILDSLLSNDEIKNIILVPLILRFHPTAI